MDNNSEFYVFILSIVSIIFLSQTITKCFSFGPLLKYSGLFIVLVYPFLVYLIIDSIKHTEDDEHKTTNHVLNTIVLIAIIILWLNSLIEFIVNIKKISKNNSVNNSSKNNNN